MFELHYEDEGRVEHEALALPVQHMTTARAKALVTARESGRKVQIKSNGREVLTVSPDGEFARPLRSRPVSEVEDCTRGSGRACFCSPCRAYRRAHG